MPAAPRGSNFKPDRVRLKPDRAEVRPHLIRDFLPEDLEGLVRMFQAGDNTPIASFRRALEAYSVMVDEARGRLRGFVGTREAEPGERDIRLYVDPAHRRRGVGRRLFEAGMERLTGSGRITAKYRADAGGGGGAAGGIGGAGARDASGAGLRREDVSDARAFYAGREFGVWYGLDELIYRGGRRPGLAGPVMTLGPSEGAPLEVPGIGLSLDIRPYDDRHFEDYVRLVGDTFEPMRRSHDFRPHNVREMNSTPERRDYFLAHRDDIFLAFGEGTLVGEAAVEGDFIDDIGVAPGHQGQGYGRILTLFCLDLLLNRGYPHPRTSVVVGNEPARGLYYRLGFELVQTNEWACRRTGSAGADE